MISSRKSRLFLLSSSVFFQILPLPIPTPHPHFQVFALIVPNFLVPKSLSPGSPEKQAVNCTQVCIFGETGIGFKELAHCVCWGGVEDEESANPKSAGEDIGLETLVGVDIVVLSPKAAWRQDSTRELVC